MDLFKGGLGQTRYHSMQITHLGSGSKGNATLISSGENIALVDSGFSLKQTEKRLGGIGINPNSIDAIVVTHHHKDHSNSALRASRAWDAELHCNLGTARRLGWDSETGCSAFGNLQRVDLGGSLSFVPIPVPHEDSENVAIIASNGKGGRAAIVTDLGEAPADLLGHLKKCNHISIESNYDHTRLMQGPYPDSLKRRISGRGGHLSNSQTAEIMHRVIHGKLDSIVLCHLSERNNAPHIAESEVLMAIEEAFTGDLSISKQDGPEFTHWTGQSEPTRLAIA